jgi:hypothetical protein
MFLLVPEVGIEPTWAQGPGDFECVSGGWSKSLETLWNLRQPLIFIEELDND